MNNRRTSLMLVAVVLALLGVIGYLVYILMNEPGTTRYVKQTKVVTNIQTQIAVRKLNATNLLAAIANRPASWSSLESTNYYAYMANLRNFGCPEETIKDIILTDIAKVYARKRSDIKRRGQPYKYWSPVDLNNAMDPKLQRQLTELDREQRNLVRNLLGVDMQVELAKYWEDDFDPAVYDFLPAEKREQVLSLKTKYEELENEIYMRAQGIMLDQDEQALRQLEQQRQVELASLLSPQELEEYELRNSHVAENLRNQLSGFEPTEEEFRRLFRLQKDFEAQINGALPNAPDEVQDEIRARAQEEGQRALQEEMLKVLGKERFAQWQQAQDPDYKALVQIADRYNLPTETSQKIYGYKVQAEQQKQRIEGDPNLNEEQKQHLRDAIAQETEDWVKKTMGPIYGSYIKVAGQWIQGLSEPHLQAAVEQP
ncbi:MAG TPA: hypothetical protein VK850_04895 [Candidatus Binatia bacterium]|nr:hypothetical protein [Candidatus Binatia bacterium]